MTMVSDQGRIFFGYGGGNLNTKRAGDVMEWTFSPIQRPVGSYKSELIQTAELLNQKALHLGRIPTVMLSGGLDSETVVQTFLETGYPFEAVTFDYAGDELQHETFFVDRYVRRYGLKHRYLKRDWRTWLHTDEVRQLNLESTASAASMLPHTQTLTEIWEVGGLPIVGGATQYVCRNGTAWNMVHEEQFIVPLARHCLNHGIDGTTHFFQYTPELLMAFYSTPRISRALDPLNRNSRMLENLTVLRYSLYREAWPQLEPRIKHTSMNVTPRFTTGCSESGTNHESSRSTIVGKCQSAQSWQPSNSCVLSWRL